VHGAPRAASLCDLYCAVWLVIVFRFSVSRSAFIAKNTALSKPTGYYLSGMSNGQSDFLAQMIEIFDIEFAS
jgi:hypothetical protein